MSTDVPGLTYTCQQYGSHDLQRVGVWEFVDKPATSAKPWIIYIHGGAWRDPRIAHPTFAPAINHLISSGRVSRDTIAGFASIDYRLSPHPDYPQDPAQTPACSLRNARHPDHLHDVQSALEFLVDKYSLSGNYILAGHSAGATLAFQLLMDQKPGVPLPTSLVGVAGIYGLVNLDHRHDGTYAGFITAAFGDDHAAWDAASPTKFSQSYEKALSSTSVILAASPDDTLIDKPEIESMTARLVKDSVAVSIEDNLTGDHDDLWEKGTPLADVIYSALQRLSGPP